MATEREGGGAGAKKIEHFKFVKNLFSSSANWASEQLKLTHVKYSDSLHVTQD